jgi:hypothetical protein
MSPLIIFGNVQVLLKLLRLFLQVHRMLCEFGARRLVSGCSPIRHSHAVNLSAMYNPYSGDSVLVSRKETQQLAWQEVG